MKKILDIFSKKKTKPKVKLKITIDHREKSSLIPSLLTKDFEIDYKQLPVADYIINNIAIERKTISDFKSSIIKKRLPQQLLELKQYSQHALILEGIEQESPYSGNIHENAFRGFILSCLLEFQVPIIFTLNEKDTAKYLYVLANKQTKPEQSIRPSKIFLTDKEQLQFILEGFPQIGPIAAKKLLKHFKTINALANTTKEELNDIIGKKSDLLYKLLNKKY